MLKLIAVKDHNVFFVYVYGNCVLVPIFFIFLKKNEREKSANSV